MAAQGRKNVHGKTGVRFKAGYTASKNKAMLRNVASELIVHGQVTVTSGVVKDLIKLVDKLVTWAKEDTVAHRRFAARYVRHGIVDENGVEALDKLFKEVGPKFKARNGGYTTKYKLEPRRGDNAQPVIIRWVD
ncbi:MAG: 50S ribosomal protein L17 [Bacilli bacterium]|nr:50S ribosomal protein L17 [Bacilli bacterium]